MYKGDATKQGVCYACQYLGCSSQRWLQSTGEKLVLILAALRRPSWPSGGGCEVRQTENCNAALECWCANLWSASRVCLAPASLTHESESTRYLPRSHEEGVYQQAPIWSSKCSSGPWRRWPDEEPDRTACRRRGINGRQSFLELHQKVDRWQCGGGGRLENFSARQPALVFLSHAKCWLWRASSSTLCHGSQTRSKELMIRNKWMY